MGEDAETLENLRVEIAIWTTLWSAAQELLPNVKKYDVCWGVIAEVGQRIDALKQQAMAVERCIAGETLGDKFVREMEEKLRNKPEPEKMVSAGRVLEIAAAMLKFIEKQINKE